MLHAATVAMIVLHTVDGNDVDVNPMQITSMREAHEESDEDHKAFVNGVRCMISLTDGKFVTVVETCDQIREMIK